MNRANGRVQLIPSPLLATMLHLLQAAGVHRSSTGQPVPEGTVPCPGKVSVHRSLSEESITLSPADHRNDGSDDRSNSNLPATFAAMPRARGVVGPTAAVVHSVVLLSLFAAVEIVRAESFVRIFSIRKVRNACLSQTY